MSYWSSGFNSVLGAGDLQLGSKEEVGQGFDRTGAADTFDLPGIALDRELFGSVSTSAWSTSRRKRLFDAAIAAPALVAFLPLMGAVAVVIKCTSRGPVMFRQERVGLGQQPFVIYKFRTMHHGAPECGPTVTRNGDGRLTSIGRVLRKLKLDEIPQLFNVVRGDMSLVGPRPKLAQHEQMYLFCRPGITGAATLVFAREEEILSSVPHDRVESYAISVLNPIKARLDLEYANSATLRSDLRLLLQTVFRLGRHHRDRLPELVEFSMVGDDQPAGHPAD